MALPIAKVAAIKDAADELGALFGRDLNRKDVVQFAGAFYNGAANANIQITQKEMDATPEPTPQPQFSNFNSNDL